MTLQRFNVGDAHIQTPTPLQDPYILWDTRNWDGSIGIGTGGLANEGTAGPSFDLDVAERVLGDGSYAYFAKQGADPEDAEWVTTSVDWDAIGGVPCDGPVTVMIAIADFPRRKTAGVDSGFPNGTAYALQYLRQGINWHWLMGAEWYNNDDGDVSGYQAATGNDKFAEFYIDSNPGDDLAVRLRLLVLVHDIADGGASAFRDTDPIPPEIDFNPPTVPKLTPFNFDVFDQDEPCTSNVAAGGSIDGGSNEQFNFIGEHRSYAPLTPGQGWNGAIGAAFFRGEPTPDDIEYWRDYFLTGYTPTDTPLGFRPDNNWTIRVDDLYVYHYIRASSGVPCVLAPLVGKPMPATVDLFMIGGGGAGFDNNATAGLPAGGGAAGQIVQASGLAVGSPAGITCYIGPGGARYTGSGRGAGQPGGISIWDLGSNTPGGQLNAFGGNAGLGTGVGGANSSFAGGAAVSPAGGGGAGGGGVGGSAPNSGEAGAGGPGVTNDWATGSPIVYGRGGNGGGRAVFGDPNIINPPAIPFTLRSGNGGNAQLTPTQSDGAGQLGFLCIRYPRMD